MRFACQSCGRAYAVSDELAGRAFKMKCKSCGHLIVVRPAAPPCVRQRRRLPTPGAAGARPFAGRERAGHASTRRATPEGAPSPATSPPSPTRSRRRSPRWRGPPAWQVEPPRQPTSEFTPTPSPARVAAAAPRAAKRGTRPVRRHRRTSQDEGGGARYLASPRGSRRPRCPRRWGSPVAPPAPVPPAPVAAPATRVAAPGASSPGSRRHPARSSRSRRRASRRLRSRRWSPWCSSRAAGGWFFLGSKEPGSRACFRGVAAPEARGGADRRRSPPPRWHPPLRKAAANNAPATPARADAPTPSPSTRGARHGDAGWARPPAPAASPAVKPPAPEPQRVEGAPRSRARTHGRRGSPRRRRKRPRPLAPSRPPR